MDFHPYDTERHDTTCHNNIIILKTWKKIDNDKV
jgi:hypothetical protein